MADLHAAKQNQAVGFCCKQFRLVRSPEAGGDQSVSSVTDRQNRFEVIAAIFWFDLVNTT